MVEFAPPANFLGQIDITYHTENTAGVLEVRGGIVHAANVDCPRAWWP